MRRKTMETRRSSDGFEDGKVRIAIFETIEHDEDKLLSTLDYNRQTPLKT